jgi:hypothetical protein
MKDRNQDYFSDNIMRTASEIYVWNCKHDSQFNTLSKGSILACTRVDLSDKIGRILTEQEEALVDEALSIFNLQ